MKHPIESFELADHQCESDTSKWRDGECWVCAETSGEEITKCEGCQEFAHPSELKFDGAGETKLCDKCLEGLIHA